MKRGAATSGRLRILLALALGVVLGLFAGARLGSTGGEEANESGWIVRSEDNVCGLVDARMLSCPAVVAYEHALEATPEVRRMRRDGIDSRSARGIALLARAADRVRAAAEIERILQGHCSVWKAIRHRDGRAIPDLTPAIVARIVEAGQALAVAPP
jgi:hypothetical protein